MDRRNPSNTSRRRLRALWRGNPHRCRLLPRMEGRMLKQITPPVLTAPQKTPSESPMPNSSSSSPSPRVPPRVAKAVDRLLNFYPPLDVNDARAFVAGLASLFARYPEEVI